MSNQKVKSIRNAYYSRIGEKHLAPLWEVFENLITLTPDGGAKPFIWHYDEIRDDIMESGDLITAREAVRRVLILENPGLKGYSKITTSLYAGLQLILPGEVAPPHRHTQAALRFILEGEGAYTAVEGEKTIMRKGDFIITPTWKWHDHGNTSENPMVWLDGLDIPIVGFFDASFAEDLAAEEKYIGGNEENEPALYGTGLLPIDCKLDVPSSPLLNYPYERSRGALEALKDGSDWDECHGLKLKYVNPVNGDYAMPSIGAFLQLLPKGFRGANYRSTDGTIFNVVEGRGRTNIGTCTFEWGPRDTFVIPSWQSHFHESYEDAVIFSFSDRPIQEKLSIWRERRGM